jgi:hypothetical protein
MLCPWVNLKMTAVHQDVPAPLPQTVAQIRFIHHDRLSPLSLVRRRIQHLGQLFLNSHPNPLRSIALHSDTEYGLARRMLLDRAGEQKCSGHGLVDCHAPGRWPTP